MSPEEEPCPLCLNSGVVWCDDPHQPGLEDWQRAWPHLHPCPRGCPVPEPV